MTDDIRPEGQEAQAAESAPETTTATAEAVPDIEPGQPLVVPDAPTGEKLRQTVDIRDAGPCRKHIRVSVDREDIDARMKDHFNKLSHDAAVPGFRPGKTPRRLLEKRFKADVQEQVKSEVLMASLQQVGEDHDVAPLSPPNLELDKIAIPDSGPFIYEFEVEVRPSFDLPPYRGLKFRRPVKQHTDEDVTEFRRLFLSRYGQIIPKADETVEIGDIITADVVFNHEGKELARANEAQVRVERQLAIKDGLCRNFGERLKGAKPGEKREIDVELSTQAAGGLAGAKLQGFVEIKDVKTVRLPELTDEFVRGMFGLPSAEHIDEVFRAALARDLEHTQRRAVRQQVLEMIAATAQWDLPRDMLIRQARKALTRRVMEMRADGVSEDKIQDETRRMQQDIIASTALALKEHFVLQKIAEVEKIEINDDDIADEIERLAIQSNESPRKLRARLEKDDMLDALAAEMIERKALDLILNTAEYEDVPLEDFDKPASLATADVQAVPGEMTDPTAPPPEAAPEEPTA